MSVTSSLSGGPATTRLASKARIFDASAAIRKATVRVPASTSNLGSGFDCVGLAIDRWLVASVSVGGVGGEAGKQAGDTGAGPALSIQRSGVLDDLAIESADDLMYAGFRRACEVAGVGSIGTISFSVASDIPVGRGLGSSAAAIVSGALLANEALTLDLTNAEVLALAVDIEGHPDNVAPALHGGAVLTIMTASGYVVTPLTVAPGLAFIIAVPDFGCDTRSSRRRLPETVPYADAVLALSRSAALVKGLETGDGMLLTAALDDVLHVPYRSQHVTGFDTVRHAALGAGAFGATLSGSGSAILAIAPRTAAVRTGEAMVAAWQSVGVDATAIGSYEPAEASAIIQKEIR